MNFIADFHIHSHFSIATSKQLVPEYLDLWARNKGLKVLGTGDFTHPGWIKELKEKLEPAEQGLYKLKEKFRIKDEFSIANTPENEPRFILTSEISSIYKKNDRVRKVHNLIFAPDFKTVEKIQKSITKIGGNITSDGRPILGLDSKHLLEMALTASGNIFFVPAHIWTPWFSVLGSKSGFDTIEECYEDLTQYIYAVETGLSANAPMHWMCSFLDKFTLLSNSDAHSPEKLGRNANIFNTELTYNSICNTIKNADKNKFLGTIDLHPQEGKYHYDGHRKCNVLWNPVETLKNNGICKVCGTPVTVGVMNRAVRLSDRENLFERKNRLPFHSIIPLKEILSEINQVGPNSKKVHRNYIALLEKLGPELNILLKLPIPIFREKGFPILAEAIERMRKNHISIKEGFDGEFGQIKVFKDNEIQNLKHKDSLFPNKIKEDSPKLDPPLINFSLDEYRRLTSTHSLPKVEKKKSKPKKIVDLAGLNYEQKRAAKHLEGTALILAGPGTGKTRVLTHRISYLVNIKNINPENILAITFTNKAADEIRIRLKDLLNNEDSLKKLNLTTFHSLCYTILKEHSYQIGLNPNFTIIDEKEKISLMIEYMEITKDIAKSLSLKFSQAFHNMEHFLNTENIEIEEMLHEYQHTLIENNIIDLDSLIYNTVILLEDNPQIREQYISKFKWILVDEFQDVNSIQFKFLKLLLDKSQNLFVIGDPNQAIYGFRGADIKHIKYLKNTLSEENIYKLKKSYRCSGYILKASNNLIELGKKHKFLEGLKKGVKIKITTNPSEKSEAEFIARTIEKMMGGLRFFSIDSNITKGNNETGFSLSDFAILCRTHSQMRHIEQSLENHSIPFQVINDNNFINKAIIHEILLFIKAILNPDYSYLKNRILKKYKLDNTAFLNIQNLAKSNKLSVTDICNRYFHTLKSNDENVLKKFQEISADFGNNLHQVLKYLTLKSEIDEYKPHTEEVTLMTFHASKGLEFTNVFLAGCEDGLIPYSLNENKKTDPMEEGRLFYVGMTRAKENLFLSRAANRFIHGRSLYLDPSPFLKKIDDELTEILKQQYKQKKEMKSQNQLTLFK